MFSDPKIQWIAETTEFPSSGLKPLDDQIQWVEMVAFVFLVKIHWMTDPLDFQIELFGPICD